MNPKHDIRLAITVIIPSVWGILLIEFGTGYWNKTVLGIEFGQVAIKAVKLVPAQRQSSGQDLRYAATQGA